MLIALLAVLGVDLIVIVVFLGFVVARKRWVSCHTGAFRGTLRVSSGNIESLGPKWRRGYGRWVRDVFVWTKGPFLFRNELVPADGVVEERPARPGEVKRLGDQPVVARFEAGEATVEVAAGGDDRTLLVGPFG